MVNIHGQYDWNQNQLKDIPLDVSVKELPAWLN